MTWAIDESMHWTDHYAEHGFARIKGVLSPSFCETCIAAIQESLGTDLPPSQWASPSLDSDILARIRTVSLFEHQKREDNPSAPEDQELRDVLDTIYDQPEMRAVIDTMFGGPEHWSGNRHYQLFITLFSPDAQQQLAVNPHLDFVNVRIPVIGNGFYFQASLVKSEPFGGNITIYPGWHKIIQKRLIEQPDFWYGETPEQRTEFRKLVGEVEPFEFVADPGDIVLFHHLVGHAGNANAATGRSPRVTMQVQAIRKDWPSRIDATRNDLSPWERSLAHNGSIDLPFDEGEAQRAAYAEREQRRAPAAKT